MCGRVIVDYDEMIPVASDSELAEWITGVPDGAASSWNVKPTQPVPVALTSAKTRERRFEQAHWSLVPPWAKDLSQKYPTFNARAETLSERRTFAPALKHQRCAVVVSGFYEWTGPKRARVPHAVFGPRPMLLMAGLYSWWRDPGADPSEEWHLTTTVITRASAGAMASGSCRKSGRGQSFSRALRLRLRAARVCWRAASQASGSVGQLMSE